MNERIQLVSWVFLAAATVASAWCAYQSALWNGEQTRTLARSTVAQFASSRKTAVANRNVTIDVATFLDYVRADLHGDTRAASFLREHARPEFKPALEAWIADKASGRADLANPFLRPEYRLVDEAQARALDVQAAADVSEANAANGHSDLYVLHTVLFALSLFFLGATSQARRLAMQTTAVAFGGLIFTASAISLARLPRASARAERPVDEAVAQKTR
jgi:hypothetical protein